MKLYIHDNRALVKTLYYMTSTMHA